LLHRSRGRVSAINCKAFARSIISETDGGFERLYMQVEPLLRRSLFRIVPPEDLDDVVQETMIRAYRKLDQFQEESSFKYLVHVDRDQHGPDASPEAQARKPDHCQLAR
jgi:hypothetical protein